MKKLNYLHNNKYINLKSLLFCSSRFLFFLLIRKMYFRSFLKIEVMAESI